MAYTANDKDYALVNLTGMAPGQSLYKYDSVDSVDIVEDAGYFNNKDDELNLAKGDIIDAFAWTAEPFATASIIDEHKRFVVTNVIDNDAAASAGNVNVAEIGLSSGLLSSDG